MITDDYGRVIFKANEVYNLLLNGVDVSEILVDDSSDINQYNSLCKQYDKTDYMLEVVKPLDITPEEEHNKRSSNWFISKDIQSIDVRAFLLSMCNSTVEWDRVNYEMDLFEERGLVHLLQLMLYIVDHFRQNKIVWGVGRGSSVASYCLYLIGVHKIDAIKYNLDVHEFLK